MAAPIERLSVRQVGEAQPHHGDAPLNRPFATNFLSTLFAILSKSIMGRVCQHRSQNALHERFSATAAQ